MKLVLFLLIICASNCQGVQSIFQPPYRYELDLQNAQTGQVIFKINTTSTTAGLTFFLLEVNTTKANVPYVDFAPFEENALNVSVDDCKVATYPEPRSHFCIDHTSGEVKLQTLYREYGVKYYLDVRAKSGTDIQSKVYTIELVDNCQLLRALETEAEKVCQVQRLLTWRSSDRTSDFTHDYSFDFGSHDRLYMVYMFVNVGNWGQKNIAILERQSGSITLNSSPFTQTRLQHPTLFASKETFKVKVTSETNIAIAFAKNLISFYFTPIEDTCKSTVCREITSKLKPGEGSLECTDSEPSVDHGVLDLRYGSYCDGTSPPQLNKASLNTDFKYDFYRGVRNSKIISGPLAAIPGSDIEYSLITVHGYDIKPTQNMTTCALQSDNSLFSFAGDTQFCMNKKTGDLYINGNFLGPLPPAELTFKVLVANLTYPYRTMEANVTVKMVDRCEPIGHTYKNFSDSCASLSSRATLTRGVFPVSGVVRCLGVDIQGSYAFPEDIDRFSVIFAVPDTNIQIAIGFPDVNKYKGLSKLVPISDLQNTQLLSNNIGSLDVFIQGNTASGQARNLQVPSNEIQLHYIKDWSACNNRNCLNIYKSWNSMTNQDPLCKIDFNFFTGMLGPCLDLKPVFTGKLTYNEKQNTLQGCFYKSLIDLNNYGYALLNDTQRINLTRSVNIDVNPETGFNPDLKGTTIGQLSLPNTYTLPDAELKSYRESGYFRCVIYDPERMSSPVMSNNSDFINMRDPIIITPAEIVNTEGSTQRIECIIDLPTRVTITKDQLFFIVNGTKRIPSTSFSQNKFAMVIDLLTKKDGGNYQCAAHPDGLDKPPSKHKTS